MENIIFIGGGGHARSCIDVVLKQDAYKIVGIVDKKENMGKDILGVSIIGVDADLANLVKVYKNVHIAIGQTQLSDVRANIFQVLKKLDARFPVLTSPLSYVSPFAHIEEGTIVLHQTLVNANAKIGKNCVLNTKALVEHDVCIGDHSYLSTGAIINGGCALGSNVFVGSGAVINQGISICENVVIGSGATVINDVMEAGVYVGSPARKIEGK